MDINKSKVEGVNESKGKGIGMDINIGEDTDIDRAIRNVEEVAPIEAADISLELSRYYDFWIGMDAVYEQWARAHNLTVNEVFLFYTLSSEKECTQSLVCERLSLPKQTVNAVLNSLEKRGFVDKCVSNKDKRNKILRLTTEGKEFADTLLGKLDILEMSALGKMTQVERHALISTSQIYLKHLADGLKAIADGK